MIPFFHPFIHIPYYLMLWYPPYLSLGLSTWLPLANDASKCDTGRTWKNVFPPFYFCHYAWARLLNTSSSIQAELQQAAVKSYRNWEEPPIQVSANTAPQGGLPGPLHPANTSLAIISLPWFHLIAPITIEIVSLVSLCAYLLFSPLESLVRRLVIRSDHQNSYQVIWPRHSQMRKVAIDRKPGCPLLQMNNTFVKGSREDPKDPWSISIF